MRDVSLRNENARQYFRPASSERDEFYELFFEVCRKYEVDWAKASLKEKAFVEEVTRVTYECRKAQREGRSPKSVPAAFSA